MVRNLHILIVFLMANTVLFGQDLISYVTVNTNSAYIGQPIELKVSVFTTTWFTKGVDVGNIQIDGGLTVYFRSVITSKIVNKKRYSGIEFYYNLFPTQQGVLEIPSLTIRVESPKEGDYKGVSRTIRTKAKKINIKSIPLGYSPEDWLVASSLTVRENWSILLKNIKVGDVVQRTISRSVGGTLSEFIPATSWDSISGVSIYPKRPSLKTDKSKMGVSASRIETVNYLFEKEGEVIIPAMEYLYWNLRTKKLYHKQIDSVIINVAPNANLAVLRTIKKSLQKENKVAEEENEFLILGLSLKEFAIFLTLVFLAILMFYKFIRRLSVVSKTIYTRYKNSEQYAFNVVKRAIIRNNFSEFIKESNIWLSKLSSRKLTLQDLSIETHTPNLKNVFDEINEAIFKTHITVSKSTYRLLLLEVKKSRSSFKKIDKRKIGKGEKDNRWLNPVMSK